MPAGQKNAPKKGIFSDPKRLHYALFRIFYLEDLFDTACGRWPRAMRLFARRIDPRLMAHKLLFIHVPRAGGTSLAHALYGGPINHYSIRYFRTINPRFCENRVSFAVLRDPYERFKSAYFFIRNGGTSLVRLSNVFVEQTAHIETVDDYLSFLESRDPIRMDFVMRPQAWFVCDPQTGAPLVDYLFRQGVDDEDFLEFLRAYGVSDVPWLNRSGRRNMELTALQRKRIRRIYAADFALIERVSRGGAWQAQPDATPPDAMVLRTATNS
jgi:hypothetical protein